MSVAPPRRKRPLGRTLAIGGAVGILAISGVGYAAASEVASQVSHTQVYSLIGHQVEDDGGTNLLLVGSDDRTGLSKKQRKALHVGQDEYGKHTDSMMIVHIADNGSVGVVSIPRDSYVEIPDFTTANGTNIPASKQKINAAYSLGGPALTVKTVEKATGVHIDHYAEINFAGFVNMVNGLGGVPVCTKVPIDDEKSNLHLKAGTTTLNGKQALAYVRARYFDPSADLGRMKRQQTFLGSVFKRAMSPAVALNPVRLMSFLNASASSVTTDENFSKSDMLGLIAKARVTSPSAISFMTVPLSGDENVPGAGDVVIWDDAQAQELFAKLKTGDPLVGPSSKTKSKPTVEIDPSQISVQVFNGTNTAGLGTKVSKALTAQGYNVVGQAQDAKSHDHTTTVIQYDPAYDTSLKTLQAAFPNAQAVPVQGLGHTFRLVVGTDYTSVTAVKTANSSSDADSDKPKTAADNICAN